MNLRKIAFLATALIGGGAATSASAYAPEHGEFRVVDDGPYAYLFERPARLKADGRGPYAYLFWHQFAEHRFAPVTRKDLFVHSPYTLR